MNRMNSEHERIECLLKQGKPGKPSAQTKNRVITAAASAWTMAQNDVPWQVPLRRLAVSGIAAAILVSLANTASNWAATAPRQMIWPSTVRAQDNTANLLPAEYGISVNNFPRGRYPQLQAENARLNEYMEELRDILEEDRSGERLAQPPGRSRLVPAATAQSWS